MSMWRRMRGLVGISLTWAVLWLFVGAALAVYALARDPGETKGVALQFIAWVASFYAVWGAISGFIFALVLVAAEYRRTVNELSMLRVSTWGFLGALALPAVYVLFFNGALVFYIDPSILLFTVTGGIGAACAAATLGLARRAPSMQVGQPTERGSLTRG